MLAPALLKQTFTIPAHVVSTVIDDGAILLDLETKYFYRVNASGWAIAQLLENGATLPHVIDQCRRWGAEEHQNSTISDFIELLLKENVVAATHDTPDDSAVEFAGTWTPPSVERQAEPLHRVIISAFDPSIPLAE